MSYLHHFLELSKGKSVVIFGASTAGKDAPNYLLTKGVSVSYFVDNDNKKFGTLFNGYIVKDPNSLLDENNPIVLITSSSVSEIYSQLLSYGIKNIFALPGLGNIGNIHLLYDSKYIEKNQVQIQALKDIVSDDLSRNTIDAIVKNRLTGNFLLFDNVYESDIFFPQDILDLNSIRVFVDIGAYNGDTIDVYKQKVKNEYDMIYAFEPDPDSYTKLTTQKSSKVRVINKGVYNENKRILFALDDIQTKIDMSGKYGIDVIKLDNFNFDYSPDYIKIHVQGSEKEVLEGAINTILLNNAVISVVLNQKPCDLWEIPLYIKNILPSSKIFIRHHSKSIVNTVCYVFT